MKGLSSSLFALKIVERPGWNELIRPEELMLGPQLGGDSAKHLAYNVLQDELGFPINDEACESISINAS